jgi:inner membrane protein
MDRLMEWDPAWVWLIAAAVMLLLELSLPGFFFMFLALAAASVGALLFAIDMNWMLAVLLFAALSVAYVYIGRPWYSRAAASDQPHLNQRQMSYVGQSYVLKEAIVNGQGKLTIDDARWDVEGPDMAAGSRVKVLAADGARLKVGAG